MSEIDEWHGAYPSNWRGIITAESFSHPAKFSSRLIERIYQHGIECGWLHEGSRIVDCFGGVGLGAWPALRYGMDWTGCELEPRFVTLAQANIDAWNAKYSGRLARWGTARISSPPYSSIIQGSGAEAARKRIAEGRYKGQRPDVWISEGNIAGSTYGDGYGSTPGNLGNLPPGSLDDATRHGGGG